MIISKRLLLCFIAVSSLLFTNLIFSIYMYPENRPIVVISAHPRAIVSLLSLSGQEAEHLSANYSTALCKLAVSFRDNGGQGHDFILLVVDPSDKLLKESQVSLRRAGWTLVRVEGIGSPLMHSSYEFSSRYLTSQMFTKLHAWRLTSYEHVTYVDSDTIVLKNPMPALEKAYGLVRGEPPGMVIDLGFCIDDYYNAGVMVIRPSVKVFRDLLFYRNWRWFNPGMAEQEFLNTFYRGEIVALPRELNVPAYYYNDSCPLIEPSTAVIAHYNGDTKPWLTNCTSHAVCRHWHATKLF